MSSPNSATTHTLTFINYIQEVPRHVEINKTNSGDLLPTHTHTYTSPMDDITNKKQNKMVHTLGSPQPLDYKPHEHTLTRILGTPLSEYEGQQASSYTSKSYLYPEKLGHTHTHTFNKYFNADNINNSYEIDPLLSTDDYIPQNKLLQQTMWMSFWANVCLLGAKIFISFSSSSMAIIACTIDSLMDVFSGLLILITQRIILQKQIVQFDKKYPAGRGLLEPVCTIIYATIMASVSVQLCFFCIQQLIFPNNTPSTVDASILFVLFFTVLIKIILWAFSIMLSRSRGDYIFVLSNDHKSDIITNTIGFVVAIILYIDNDLRVVDNIGALFIAGFASLTWIYSNRDQIRVLSGYKADSAFYPLIAAIVADFPEITLDDIKAYHFGVRYMVEIAIVMHPSSTVRDYVQLEKRLQRSIRNLSTVQQCFISIDYKRRFTESSTYSENMESKAIRRRPIESNK